MPEKEEMKVMRHMTKKNDKAEELAYRWLMNQGFSVECGDDPPDFTVDNGTCGVEVTRLLKRTPRGDGVEYDMVEKKKRGEETEPIEMFDFKGMPVCIKGAMTKKSKIIEKSGKLPLFEKWWLILVDYFLEPPVSYTDHEFVRDVYTQISVSYPWSKVTLIHRDIFRPEVWFTDQGWQIDAPAPTQEDFWRDIPAAN